MTGLFEVLLAASVRSLAVAGVVLLLLRILRVGDAAVRNGVWRAMLAGMLLMPVLPKLFPVTTVVVPMPDVPVPVAVMRSPVAIRPAVTGAPLAVPPVIAAVPIDWESIAMTIYLGVAGVLLLRLLAGWRRARRMVGAGRYVAALDVVESAEIGAPMTVGVFALRILLPVAFRQWPRATLQAVLAHERAHVSRRDTAVAVLARLNTCLFWFHPLAWRLERVLAETAELACDRMAVESTNDRKGYGEALVAMARVATRRAAMGVAMDGAGFLEQRLDLVLSGEFGARVSRGRRFGLGAGCAVAILAAAACSRDVAPLRDNPLLADRERRQKLQAEIEAMTAEGVAELENRVRKSPEDMAARETLLHFYSWRGDMVLGKERTVAARRPHVLWVIAHRPASELAGSWGARIFPTDNDRDADPAGYAQAKALWLREVEKPGATSRVLANAATFFQVADKPIAEQLLQRLQTMEPGKGWSGRLGQLYYEVLLGSNSSMPMGVIRSVSMEEAHGARAQAVRRKLEASTDVELLLTTGQMLMDWGGRPPVARLIDFDVAALGRSYVERAERLDPQSVAVQRTKRFLKRRAEAKLNIRIADERAGFAALEAVPERERFPRLSRLAETRYIQGDMADYYRKDAAAASAGWAEAKRSADEALRLAEKYRDDNAYGPAAYRAHLISGLLAMRDGDRKRAVRHLLAAPEVPASEEMAYSMDYGSLKLAGWLLKDGERDTVIRFLERLAAVQVSERANLLGAAESIRNGVKPVWYPRE